MKYKVCISGNAASVVYIDDLADTPETLKTAVALLSTIDMPMGAGGSIRWGTLNGVGTAETAEPGATPDGCERAFYVLRSFLEAP